MANNQLYWHRYLKQRGITKIKGGMYSITDMAVMVHKTLYNESKTFNKPEAKTYLSEQKEKLISKKNKLNNVKTNGCAYFIGNMEYRWVKIGSATKVMDRLSALQTGCPFELEVLAHIPTYKPRETEKKLHRSFRKQKCRGEWFNIDDHMIEFINQIREKNEPYKTSLCL